MEIPISHEQASFFLKLLLNYVSKTHVSFDKAFRHVISKYGFPKHIHTSLYKLGYYTLTYYYTLRWLSSKYGYGLTNAGIVNFFASIGFSLRELFRIAREESRNLSLLKRISVQYSYPEYLVKDLLEKLPESEVVEVLDSLNERKRWLRVNLLKASIDEALNCLSESGIQYSRSDYTDIAVRIHDPLWSPIAENKCVKSYYLVPQDVSSVLSIEALPVKPTEVLDACSAPGLKLSLLYMMHRDLRAVAVDISRRRITAERILLRSQGVDVRRVLLVVSDASTLILSKVFDLAIVDAPCSGWGAVYSDPAIKLGAAWRSKLEYYHDLQVKILENTLRYARNVLYITCSIHPREGEEVIEEVVKRDMAEPMPLHHKALSKAYPGYIVSNETYRIKPQKVHGQGFYIALLKSRVADK